MAAAHDPRHAFERVADALRERIASKDLPPGAKLPSFSEIQEQYGVAVTTAQRALRALKAEGLIEGHAGRGTFVRKERKIMEVTAGYVAPSEDGKWLSWRESARRQGMDGTQELVSVAQTDPPDDVADALGLPDGAQAVVRRRLMLLDGHPVQLADSYYPLDVADGTPLAEHAKIPGGASKLLADMGHLSTKCEEVVTAHMPSPEEARTLQLDDGVPVLRLFRVVKAGDRAVEANVFTLAADRHKLMYSLPAQNC